MNIKSYRTIVIILSILLALIAIPCSASEKEVVEAHCKGEIEVRLPDNTRVDCLTAFYAMEYDYGPKWAEAIGQSLHYAMHTGKRAYIVLILKRDADKRYVRRAEAVIDHYGLPISIDWTMEEQP